MGLAEVNKDKVHSLGLFCFQWPCLKKASRKKVAVLLDFVQITSTPPPSPNFDNLHHFFWKSKRTATIFREIIP